MTTCETSKTTDVVIVGGGIVGCATAYYLAKSGVKSVVLEKGDIASEGSGLSGGVVRLLYKHPSEIPLMLTSLKVWEGLSAELGCDTGFERMGIVDVIRDESKLAQAEEYSRTMRETFGVDFRVIDPNTVRELVPPLQGSIAGGLYCSATSIVNDAATTKGFANAARKLGAEINTNTPCWDIEVCGGAVSAVVTNNGRIKTKTVVNAAGIYAPRIAKMVGFHMPVKVVTCGGSETGPMPPHFRCCVQDHWGNTFRTARGTFSSAFLWEDIVHHVSFGDLQDLKLWLPIFRQIQRVTKVKIRVDMKTLWREVVGTVSPSREARMSSRFPNFQPDAPNISKVKASWEVVAEALPVFKDVQIARTWSGMIDMTPDGLPLVGELDNPRGFLMAAGWSGHGISTGPLMGRLIAQLIVEDDTSLPLHSFSPARFSSHNMEKLDVNSLVPGAEQRAH